MLALEKRPLPAGWGKNQGPRVATRLSPQVMGSWGLSPRGFGLEDLGWGAVAAAAAASRFNSRQQMTEASPGPFVPRGSEEEEIHLRAAGLWLESPLRPGNLRWGLLI